MIRVALVGWARSFVCASFPHGLPCRNGRQEIANMTTTELSQAVESVAFMIRGEPRAVELRYLHGLLDMLTEWESTHPDEADAEPLVTAIHGLVSTLVLNAEPGA
jgi:hypothetical protein